MGRHLRKMTLFTKQFRLGGTHYKTMIVDPLRENDVITLDFSMVDINTVVIKDTVYHKSDHPTKLPKGYFTTKNGKLLVHLDREKIVRPIVTVTYRQKEELDENNIAKLNRKNPSKSDLYVKSTIKNKISWGCSPCKIAGIDITRSIPSKYGKILFDGNMFFLENRVIAVIQENVVVPKLDVTTDKGAYVYNRVLSIFELSHVKTPEGLLNMENNMIFLNGLHIATVHEKGEIKISPKHCELYEKVWKYVHRMLAYDDSLEYCSPKKINIKAALV